MDAIEAAQPTAISEKHFTFTGNVKEYFSIWIVNVLLTLLTLGIYSAWAKVRTTQYFYGNTQLDEHSFRYLAKPTQILKGRIIAIILFSAYYLSGLISPMATAIAALVLILLLPALIVMSMSFQLQNLAHRNIRFGFQKDWIGIYKIGAAPLLILLPYILILTMTPDEELATGENLNTFQAISLAISPLLIMLTYPLWEFLLIRFKITRASFGTQPFLFTASGKSYYKIYLAVFGIMTFMGLLVAVIIGLAGSVFSTNDNPVEGTNTAFVFLYLIMIIPYLWMFAYIHTRKTNLVYSNLVIGEQRLSSTMEVKTIFALYVTNTLAIALSLGLLIPWARIRTARYRAEKTSLLVSGNLDRFVNAEQKNQSALGEGIGDVFDLDLGM